MSVKRTPPNSPATITNLLQVRSDSDIPLTLSSGTFENVNTSVRSKRPRPESSPIKSELHDFKQEIRQMLTNWKKEQEEYYMKITNEQNTHLKKLVSEITTLKSQNNSMQKSFSEIEKSIAFIGKQYDDMAKQIDSMQKEKRSYRDSIQNMETKLQDIQQLSRPSIVEVRNVPIKENESSADLTSIITNVGTVINKPINPTLIRDVYRLPGKPGTVRPIVAEFFNVETKNQFIASARNFNKKHPNEGRLNTLLIGLTGDRRPLYVAEYLPSSSRKLFFAAREFAKRMDYKFCWTANGRIFLRKVEGANQHYIKSEHSLTELEKEANQ